MELDFVHPSATAPGDWDYTHPISEVTFTAPTFGELVALVTDHEEANDYEITPPNTIKQDFLKRLIDTHPHLVKVRQWKGRKLSQYWKGLGGANAIAKFELHGRPVQVSSELANRRADICAHCPFNAEPKDKSLLMQYSDKLMSKMAGAKEFKQKLHNCAVCSCPLVAKVGLTIELLQSSGDTASAYPVHCWIKIDMQGGQTT